MRRDGGSVLPAHANTGPKWPIRGRSANKTARALISMMARSTTCSNQKPDTLMQDRTSARSTKPSCNARPDHTLGQKPALPCRSIDVRFDPNKQTPTGRVMCEGFGQLDLLGAERLRLHTAHREASDDLALSQERER